MYKLGSRSKENMEGLHPLLVQVVEKAIGLTTQDFGVAARAVRTAEEQNKLYQRGRTKPGPKVTDKDGYKNKSNHQVTADGYGHSVDLTAWTGNAWDFDTWDRYFDIAWAMCQAAKKLGVRLRWGGNWNEDFMRCESRADVAAMHKRYQGKLPDGPHFELTT